MILRLALLVPVVAFSIRYGYLKGRKRSPGPAEVRAEIRVLDPDRRLAEYLEVPWDGPDTELVVVLSGRPDQVLAFAAHHARVAGVDTFQYRVL